MGLIMYQEGHVVKSMVCGVCWNYFNSYIYYAKITPKYDGQGLGPVLLCIRLVKTWMCGGSLNYNRSNAQKH